MKLTNGEIVTLYEGLYKLREGRSAPLPIKVGFSIIKDMKILEPIYSSITTMRNDIAQRLGTPQDNGYIEIPSENVEEANREFENLSEIENQIDLDLISLSSLQNLQFSLDEINALYPIINSEA